MSMTYDELAREYGEACRRNLEKDAEITRLREEAKRRDKAYDALHGEAVKETQNLFVAADIVKDLRAEIARLRAAITKESESHNGPGYELCRCALCEIAREGR